MDRLSRSVRQCLSLLDIKALHICKVSSVIVSFLKNSLKLWNINLFLNHTKGSMKSDKININCGISQGDSLSSLLFCWSLIPLTNKLNNSKYGYEIYEQTINHLFYMDDLKLYGKSELDIYTTIRELHQDGTYKVLEINKGNNTTQ